MNDAPELPRFGEPDRASRPATFGRVGAVTGAAVVAALLLTVVWTAVAGSTPSARHPQLFGGSLVLEDQRPLSVLDLATAQVTVRLPDVYRQVGATTYGQVLTVPVAEGTFLVDDRTGAFNLLGRDDYVLDPDGGGIGLGPLAGSTGATALADGSAAYVVRTAPRSTVSLVDGSTVAQGARAAARRVTPLGFALLDGTTTGTADSAAVVVAGDLWVLVGAGGGCRVEQLHPVRAAHDGLVESTHGTLPLPCGDAAITAVDGGAGATSAATTAGPAVAVASPGNIRLYGSGSGSGAPLRVVATPATVGATGFVATAPGAPRSWWLVRRASGWSVLGVDAAGAVTGPAPAVALGPAVVPAPPAEAGGLLYTLDRDGSGQPALWRIDPQTGAVTTVPGEARYPARTRAERAAFTAATVVAVGPRVVFDNPGSILAVVVFTDGQHPPVAVDKGSALDVSTTGPGLITLGPKPPTEHGPGRTTPAGPSAPVTPSTVAPVPPQEVDTQLTCADTTVKPYAPQVTSVTPSTQTALVRWSYQLLDQQDCEPTTWGVTLAALDGGRQPARPVQEVDGQDALLVVGLRPATTYRAVVTAYINRQSTPSAPVTFTTAAQGPDSPTRVVTTADSHGDWVVTWTACRADTCLVPAGSWTVTANACGGSFVGQPPTVQVPAGADTAGAFTATLDAVPLGLLGRSVSFSVQGATADGLAGNPTSDHACTQAWRTPAASALALRASALADGPRLATTLQLQVSGDPTTAFGTTTPELVYSVGGHTVGPTAATEVQVPGLTPGATYTPTVRVYPAGHPTAAVTVTGQPFSRTVAWPKLGLQVAGSPDPGDPDAGTVIARVDGLGPGSYTAAGRLTCASTGLDLAGPLTRNPVTSGPVTRGPVTGEALVVDHVDLLTMGGPCRISLTVSETAEPNPYGVTSPALQGDFELGASPSYGFASTYSPSCEAGYCQDEQVEVDFDGPGSEPAAGTDWTVVAAPTACAQSAGPTADPTFPVTLTLPARCRRRQLQLSVDYTYLGAAQTVAVAPLTGTPGTTTVPTSVPSSSTVPSSTVPPPSTTTASTTPTTPTTTTPTTPPTTAPTPTPPTTAPEHRPPAPAPELAAAAVPVPTGTEPIGGWLAGLLAGLGVLALLLLALSRPGEHRPRRRDRTRRRRPSR